MQISINGKDFNLNFGVRFVRELDQVAGMKVNVRGIEQSFGMGLNLSVPSLRQYDPAVLSDVIYCAAWDNKKRPSQKDIDDYLDNPDTDIMKLFDDVMKEMESANAVKAVASKISKNTKA